VASGVLIYALVTGTSATPTWRSIVIGPCRGRTSSPHGGEPGRLALLWSWLLATYSSVAIVTQPAQASDVMPYVTAILMTTQTFFLILNRVVVSPFRMLAADGTITAVPDGQGLNPLLQYPMMRIIRPCCTWLRRMVFLSPSPWAR